MHLDTLKELIAERAATRFLEKRGMSIPMTAALALQAPELGSRAVRARRDVRDRLNRASREQLDESVKSAAGYSNPVEKKDLQSFSKRLNNSLTAKIDSAVRAIRKNPASKTPSSTSPFLEGLAGLPIGTGLPRSVTPGGLALSLGGQAAASALGSLGAVLLKDIYAKAKSSIGAIGSDAARKAVLEQLKKEDPILSNASDANLMESFHTMARFAPTLSTDKNAVRSFLRQAVMGGTGPDFTTIKLLAESERAVTGKSGKE